MSLINEALRKAQNQRNKAPGLGDDTNLGNQPVNYAPQPRRLGLMIGLALFIVILLGLVAGLTIVIISEIEPQTAQKTGTPALPATPSIKTASEPGDVVSTEATTATAPEQQPQIPKTSEQSPEVIKAPVAKPEPNQKITDWLEQSTISGVRITSSSSKVILNNKAYMPDKIVNMPLGLKILEIEPERITFIDSNGVEYIKLF